MCCHPFASDILRTYTRRCSGGGIAYLPVVFFLLAVVIRQGVFFHPQPVAAAAATTTPPKNGETRSQTTRVCSPAIVHVFHSLPGMHLHEKHTMVLRGSDDTPAIIPPSLSPGNLRRGEGRCSRTSRQPKVGDQTAAAKITAAKTDNSDTTTTNNNKTITTTTITNNNTNPTTITTTNNNTRLPAGPITTSILRSKRGRPQRRVSRRTGHGYLSPAASW